MIGKILDLVLWVLGLFKPKAPDTARQLGQAETRDAVSAEALRRTEDARKSKEATDAEIRRTPYDDRVDRL